MARVKLTAGRVRDFECPQDKNQAFLWDSDVPGLGVRATSGSKVFVFQNRLDGKTIRVKIGDCRTWVIDSADPAAPGARQEARRLQAMMDQGVDPRIEKQARIAKQVEKKQQSDRQEVAAKDAWEKYLADRRDHWSDRHLADHFSIAETGGTKRVKGKGRIKAGPLAKLLPMRLADIDQQVVESWLKTEAKKRPARARLAYALLRAFLNWCDNKPEYKGLCAPDACSTRIKRDTLPKQKPKADCLQREQLPAWFNAVREFHNPVISAYLQTLLLIGARREELARLQWEDIDFQWNSLTIRDKVEGERTIPLTPYVARLLSPLPRRNQWVFSSPTSASKRISEPRHGHNKCLVKAGIDGLTIHGLRRSFGTLSEWVECPVGVVAQIMGHKPSAIAEKHYRQRPLDLLRMWHVKIEKWILDQAGIEQPVNGETGLRIVEGSRR
ncbi:prophage integrase IntF [Desulfosarcina ovata subsp. sediminis]|uniref:Prophage integrase IntF n=1 Tax=Desulfosarcina ovata subsp. sediminis TaxID=885957 RepID=A0A5K7ZM63_9BACT|nr:tyrosine-type recombinase/integrase [Desulfosarcina ovata]BBO81187.1 prophage integrase IntF [Desulfosarcina ovata subsp. sediminis]